MSQAYYAISPLIEKNTYINADTYQKWYKQSLENPELFWGHHAKNMLDWIKPWDKVLTGTLKDLNVRWFQGAKINAAYNCLDRHLRARAQQKAIIWESNEPNENQIYTYQALYEHVVSFASVLRRYGVNKGDRVCIYLPMIPELIIAMLACARIGAVHSVVFAGFSAEALKQRILDADCQLVITANESKRGEKYIPLKEYVDLALKDCKSVKHVIVVQRTKPKQNTTLHTERDLWYHDCMAEVQNFLPPEEMDAEDPLFILYTSGSTGQPKGIVHATAGYLLYVAMTFKYVFDYHPDEVFFSTADIGWIAGHSYSVYGPLLNGATLVMYEGTPTYPTPARYWEIIDKYEVNIFYTAPTAIRALRKEGDSWVRRTKRKSLRLLGTVGEPINPEAWKWYFNVVGEGRCALIDTWWQTETGGIMISPLPGAHPYQPGSASRPFFGVVPKIVGEQGDALPPHKMGKLVIAAPWPGMMKTIYKDPNRFKLSYFTEFPGYYSTGDQAYYDEAGNYWIVGRVDDVIKISGHRIGTQEIESAFLCHSAVSEAAVVAVPDDIKGQTIYAFVTLKLGFCASIQLREALIHTVRNQMGAIVTPHYIQFTAALPKTRSGKILRRLLRKIANNEADLGDLSTLAEREVIDELVTKKLKI